ncbi:MAG TPA: NAD-dependent epimerase/dehydratase family protein [Puia sp.]|jgi:dTDP-glucose 4,6-dehydratase/UDP-glucose 4-epimerase
MSGEKIFIAGSEGFIGRNLVNYFKSEGFEVFGCDLSDFSTDEYTYFRVSPSMSELEEILRTHNFSYCINSSGSGSVPNSLSDPINDFEANSLTVVRLLDAIRRYRPECRFLQISSAAVYGNPQKLPVSEELPCAPLSPYGYHKWISELICREYTTLYKMRIAIVRPFSTYGPGQRKQILWDICTKIKNEDYVKLFGTGNESRDFIHVHDLAVLMHCIIKSDKFNCDIFNAASGKESKISEIVAIFKEYYKEGKFKFSGEERLGDPLNWQADISKVSSLGFQPSMSLDKGILEYLKWFEMVQLTR